MSELIIKVQSNSINIELQGESEVVTELFREIRDQGVGLVPKMAVSEIIGDVTKQVESQTENDNEGHKIPEVTPNISVTNDIPLEHLLPNIQEIAVSKYPQNEVEWNLIYGLYSSNFGKESFTKENIRAMYRETGRASGPRYKKIDASVRQLVVDKLISVVDKDNYKITETGITLVKEILGRQAKVSKASNTSNGNGKKTKSPQYIELDISEEAKNEIKEEYLKIKPSANMDKILTMAFLLKEKVGVNEFDLNIMFSVLAIAGDQNDINLKSTIKNMKLKQYNYIQNSENKDFLKLTSIGEAKYKRLKDEKSNGSN